MKLPITKGSTSVLAEVFVRDSSSTTGAGLTGLVFNSASLTAYYYRSGAATATSISLQTMTLGTWASGGFKEIDATNMPGWYQIGLPDAALITGTNKVEFHLKGAANMAPLPFEIQLKNFDDYDGVRGGLTALPNAAAGTTGGLGCLVLASGTASAGAATSITLAGASATDNFYNHQLIHTTGGTGANQTRLIIGYVGSTKVATVSRAWAVNPDSTTTFEVIAAESMPTWNMVAGTLSAATSTTATLTGAVATDSYYNGGLLVITAGTGQRQARTITGYVGGTTVATVDRAWATTPDSTSVFVVFGANDPKLDNSLQVTAASVQGNVTGSVGSVTGAVGSVTGSVGSVTGAVGSVTAGVTVTTNNDKTGYALTTLESSVLVSGTASAGSSTTLTLAGASTTANLYNGLILKIYGGTGAGQARVITAYSGSRVATVDTVWTTTPDATSQFAVIAIEAAKLDSSQQVTAASVQGNVTGSVASVTGAVGSVTGAVGSVTGNVGGNVTGSVGSVVGAVGSVTGSVGSVTGNVGGNVVGSVASVAAAVDILQTAADKVWGSASRTLTAFAQGFSDQVWTTAARTLTAFGFSVTVGTNNDKTGYGLASNAVDAAQFTQAAADKVWTSATRTLTAFSLTLAQSVWDVLAASVAAANSIGLQLKTNIDAAVSSRLASGSYTAPPSAASISTQVWTEPIPGAFGAGSAGAKLNSAGSASDPLASAVPGSYASGTAGNILGNRLDAAVSTRLATSGYTAPLDAATTKAQVVSALTTDTYAEPASVPAATASLKDKIAWLFVLSRNKITQTATTQLVRNDGDSATVGTSTVSDDLTTGTRGKFS